MSFAYRIFKTKFSDTWFDGEGAFRFGGRWNSPGRRVVYTAEHLALSALEMLVHLRNEEILLKYSFAVVEFDQSHVLSVEEFLDINPDSKNKSDLDYNVRRAGDEWIKSSASVVLRVPTAVLPIGYNYIINIDHPNTPKLKLGEVMPFLFDQRIAD